MVLQSDITVNYKSFDPGAISPATVAFNTRLQDIMAKIPKWYEVGSYTFPALSSKLTPSKISYSRRD
jgi:hypothetical protein